MIPLIMTSKSLLTIPLNLKLINPTDKAHSCLIINYLLPSFSQLSKRINNNTKDNIHKCNLHNQKPSQIVHQSCEISLFVTLLIRHLFYEFWDTTATSDTEWHCCHKTRKDCLASSFSVVCPGDVSIPIGFVPEVESEHCVDVHDY